MATSSVLLCCSLYLLFLFRGSLAQFGLGFGQSQGMSPWQSPRRFGGMGGQCRLDRLDVMEPVRRMQFEAGRIEYFDENNEQLRCAGLFAKRIIMEPRGLLLPSYANAPSLVYIIQGRGMTGMILPGCPETYQSFQMQQYREEGGQSQSQSQRPRDEHQKIHHFREGDIIALPAGVTHWCYNDGDTPVVAIQVFDTSSNANQLDPRLRKFLLAGSGRLQRGQQMQTFGHEFREMTGNSILSGFDIDFLAESMGVNREVARRLQSQNDQRGEIVRVEHGLHLMRPSFGEQQQQQQEGAEEMERREQRGCPSTNGLDETYCNMRIKENINEASRADIYNPQGGRITYANTQKLPILNLVQMSAARGVLHRNAMLAPLWNINAHSVMFVTRGHARIQVVNNQGRTVFDGEVRGNQLLVIPQNYAVIKRAGREGCEWVSFKTNSNAMVSQIAGKASAFRGMPVDVLMNSYRLSREEAQRLKFNRGDEMGIFAPKFQRPLSFA